MTTEPDTDQAETEETNTDEGDAPEAVETPPDPLAEAEQRADALKEQLLRTAADFDNYRKRSKREVDEAKFAGRDAMFKELLPVFDNLQRAGEAADKATDVAALASGIDMVMRQFDDTLRKLGIERVESVGTPFNPAVHEAIQQIETDQVEPGHIAAEVQSGYRKGDRLIRAAMVVVAKASASSTKDESADN